MLFTVLSAEFGLIAQIFYDCDLKVCKSVVVFCKMSGNRLFWMFVRIIDGATVIVHSEAKFITSFTYVLDAALGALNHVYYITGVAV